MYFGALHDRLGFLYDCNCEDCRTTPHVLTLAANKSFKSLLNAVEKAFKKLHTSGSYKPESLFESKEYKALVEGTTAIFNDAIEDNKIPAEMLQSLQQDTFIFSALKTNAQLLEASKLLLTDDGKVKSFTAFSNDISKIKSGYNQNYLEAEYQFAVTSSQMAGKWAAMSDDYDIQYRTAGDARVRVSHAALHNITLPKSDPFWLSYYPPNGWRCRCNAVEVRKGKYEISDPEKSIKAGEAATTQIGKNGKNKLELFRFNPGAEKKVFPPKNPYAQVAGAPVVKKGATVAIGKKTDDTVFSWGRSIKKDWVKQSYHKAALAINKTILPVESFGIFQYSDSRYGILNKYLRKGRKPKDYNLDTVISVINTGMDKFPDFKGPVLRATNLDAAQVASYRQAFRNDLPHVEKGYLSTTKKTRQVFEGDTLFTITSKSGKNIETMALIQDEEEILFKPGTQFKVTGFVEENGRREIEMIEI